MKPILVDVHAHLEILEDLDAVIQRARDANVKKIIAISRIVLITNFVLMFALIFFPP